MQKQTPAELSDSDLSEQIKEYTKDSHNRAENTEMMRNYQRGQITLPQYKLLLSSLYEIYKALEESMDLNCDHPSVAPVYFPTELARLDALEKDIEYFYGQDWREQKLVIPAATKRYAHRIRQIGKDNPEHLVAHAYTRYLGDLSGGQMLSRITQKSLGLKGSDGLAFFSFPGVSSPSLFKQLYRSRMNSIEMTEEQRKNVLDEAHRAFELNIEMFDDLHKTERALRQAAPSQLTNGGKVMATKSGQGAASMISTSPFLRVLLGFCLALATVGMGIYTF